MMQALLYTSCSGKKAFSSGAEARQRPSPLSLAPLAKAGLRHPASASLSLASCWPLPQQLLPVSAAGGGRRRCPKGGATGVSVRPTRDE